MHGETRQGVGATAGDVGRAILRHGARAGRMDEVGCFAGLCQGWRVEGSRGQEGSRYWEAHRAPLQR